MLPSNVVTLRKEEKEFPDLFPKGSFLEVAYAVMRNVPSKSSKVEYAYALKPNEPIHFPASIILQKGGNVLFNPIMHFGDNSRLQNWVNANAGPLRQMAQGRPSPLTVVGKITNNTFCVYYVIEEGEVFFDVLSISQRMLGHTPLLGTSLSIVPVINNDIKMVIDRDRGGLEMPLSEKIPEGASVIAVPVTTEHREDSDVPRLYTDAARMRFFSFTYGP